MNTNFQVMDQDTKEDSLIIANITINPLLEEASNPNIKPIIEKTILAVATALILYDKNSAENMALYSKLMEIVDKFTNDVNGLITMKADHNQISLFDDDEELTLN